MRTMCKSDTGTVARYPGGKAKKRKEKKLPLAGGLISPSYFSSSL